MQDKRFTVLVVDDDMALFDVPTALSRLATAFGVSEQYETLLLDDPNGSSEE